MYSFPYLTLGSGSLAAMAVIESQFVEDLSEEKAMNLCIAAIEAGVYHDLGSGSNVDVVVIKQNKVTLHRNIKSDNKKEYSKPGGYVFPKDKIKILEEYKSKIIVSEGPVPMDLSWKLYIFILNKII